MFQSIENRVTDVKRKINPLEKDLGNMIKIQEPNTPWEIFIWIGFSKTPIFFPCNKDDTALLIWNRVISWTGIFTDISSDRDLELTSELWKNPHQLFGTKLFFSTAYHPQSDGLAEIMIQNLEEMVRIFCAYGIELKHSTGLTNYWCTLLPALELEYKKSIHASINQTPAILEKGWNPRISQNSLRKHLFERHTTASSFKEMLEKSGTHELICMKDSFSYAKEKWDKSHATPDFKVGELVIVSTTNFNNVKG
ncbi:hypothetical protein O181_002015 [Austropuccinia psidii MF-1]|uniref:Integrase catalytic domain-containing protein n=1 Tax=Austropuccinia psidii MF-1 TaxID=1389203 RepID=A0A9Q3BC83_9BASI|nr:hypothetical protein [Austropuccinia psidii MF-1]